jgi:hypothetical protein
MTDTAQNFYLDGSTRRFLRSIGWRMEPKLASLEQVRQSVTEKVLHKLQMKNAGTIHKGACFLWAWLCSLYNPRIKLISSNGGHAIIEFQGEFYDSEGKVQSGRLEMEDPCLQNRAEFAVFWGQNGHYKQEMNQMCPTLIPIQQRQRWRALSSDIQALPPGIPITLR